MLFLVFLVFCVTLLFAYWKIRKNNVVPLCDNYLPIIGHTHMIIGDTRKLLRSTKSLCNDAQQKGGVAIFELGFVDYYVVTDPEDTYKIQSTTNQKHYVFRFASSWLGDGLVTASGETWKRQRKLLNPAFSQQMLNQYCSVFNSQTRILVSNIDREMKTGPVDITRLLKQWALKSLVLTTFGMEEVNEEFNVKYTRTVDEFLAIIINRIQNPILHNALMYRLSGWKRKEDKLVKELLVMSNMILSNKKMALMNSTQMENTETNSKSIFELLVKGLTETEMREEIDTIIVAGYDTTSWALTVLLVLLGSYPEIQDKVYKEIISVFGDSDAVVDKSIYPRLDYCEAVIKESLRLYPIFPVTLRVTEFDTKLRNCTIPAGSSCILGIYVVNRHPVWGPDADTFRPERWLESGGVPEDTNTFATFGLGKRTCIGKAYSLMAMKTALVHIIRRYEVTADISKVEFKMEVLMTPTENCKVEIKSRKC